ncbi:reverse transcriptase domain-containing protein [Trichonephila inaurata madagascariensis]|uniref:Reverse transcriptase domain-containing protein n=1 Tax=Trichonephila inaurata madagascariensis TaxID=2747483 RepID=A0A8X7C4N4_9ARAC|nr:reverse transcriptase domain-containing protein [Trichonephila inaurata madagascariensis]
MCSSALTVFVGACNHHITLKPCFYDNSSETDIESSIGEDTPNKPAKMPKKKIRFAPLPLPTSTRAIKGGRQVRLPVPAPRKVPLAIHNKVKEKLSNMVEAGIISKVEEPTEWVSNMVVINSPKKLRICLDPRPLNEAIQRPHYPIPTTDALITKLQVDTDNSTPKEIVLRINLDIEEESENFKNHYSAVSNDNWIAYSWTLNPQR